MTLSKKNRMYIKSHIYGFRMARILCSLLLIFFSFSSLIAAPLTEEYEIHKSQAIEALPAQYQTWISQQSTQLNLLGKKISKKRGSTDLYKSFSTFKKLSKYLKQPATVGSSKENLHKNRYKSHIAYDATRTMRDVQGFYYNASDVITPHQKYILCEAPLQETLSDFWNMVVATKAHTIVTLVTPYERGKYNMEVYWDESRFPILVQDEWTISKTEERIIAEKKASVSGKKLLHRIIVRKFRITPVTTNESGAENETSRERILTQIHYWNWPDKKIPDDDMFIKLLNTVEKEQEYNESASKDPIIVHCAAGVGRSGTFVAAHSLIRDIVYKQREEKEAFALSEISINIPERIIALRRQRSGIVSTYDQYKSIVKAIATRSAELE